MNKSHTHLGELCDFVKGQSPISQTLPGPFPLVTTGEGRKTSDSYQFDTEAVCIPLISSTGHGHASLKRVHYQEGKFALGNLLVAALVRDRTRLSPKYLAHYLNFTKDRLIVPLMTGAANMSLSLDRLATVPVEFPSLMEQQRTVATLEETEHLRALRADTGRLQDALRPAYFHDIFGDLVSNSKGWPIVRFQQLGNCRLGKMLDAKQQTGQNSRLYLRNTNVQWDRLELSDLLSMDFNADEQTELRLQSGDLLICEGGEVGRAAIWNDELPECYFQKALHRLRVDREVSVPEFVVYLLRDFAENGGFAGIVESATIPHLTGEKLRELRVPLPPIHLQREFVAQATQIRVLESEQAASRHLLEDLLQSFLYSAFQGES